MRSLTAALLLTAALAACGPPTPAEWTDADGHRWRPLDPGRRGDAGFVEVAPRSSGIDFANRLTREMAMEQDHLLVGSGIALGDFDGDGLVDVYLPRLDGPNVLYRNLGGWSFEDVTGTAGVAAPGRYSTGAAFADVEGDGDLDLFVTALGGPDALFVNQGDGTFVDGTASAGLMSDLGSTSSTFGDVDGDGDLDLYVVRYKVESAADVLRPYEQASVELVVEGEQGAEIAEAFEDHFRMETRDGRRVAVEQADPDRLYLNDGDGTFTAVPWTGGRFLDVSGSALSRDLDDFGLAARFYDVDGDGDLDLYVCNDFDDPDQLWLNDGSGYFQAAPDLALRTTSHASMAVDFADLDRDGSVDFFVADMLSADPGRRLAQVPLHAGLEKPVGWIDNRPQAGRNTLFLGRGDGTWAQVAEMSGVDGSEWTWGSAFLDVDLDGFEDLLVVNGHGRDMRDGDALARITGLRGSVTWNEAKSLYPDLPTRNRAFRNRGDGSFEDASDWGFGADPDVSHGIAMADLDSDGDLDVVVNRLNEPLLVYRNTTAAGRVSVRLVGQGANRQGIGARVRLLGGAVPVQERQMTAGGLYLSGSDATLTFATDRAAGVASSADGGQTRNADDALTLEVVWPAGGVSRLPVEADRAYEIYERAARGDAGQGPGSDTPSPVAPLFEDRTASLDARHVEDDFDDRVRQPTLSRSLARLGPGVTWADLDADGDADLVLPAGRSGHLTQYRNENGTFRAIQGAETEHDQTTALPLSAGNGRVLVGQTSHDAASGDEARELSGVVEHGWGAAAEARPVAAPDLSSVGALAQADVDGDGDLDLFVGGRSVPAFYPLPASSRIYLNSESGYVAVDVPALKDVGLVSGAVFTDLDGDGDPDLALAIEWGPVTVLENTGTGLEDRTQAWGLAARTGLWKGITAGDLDGDGRMDLVVTNDGLNTRWSTSAERPLRLVHADVDQSGSWEAVLARSRRPGGPLHPLGRYEQLRVAIPALSQRVPAFMEYGDATLEDVLGAPASAFFQLEVTEVRHGVFMGRPGGFEWTPLHSIAQRAPAHGVTVADFDGDGAEDVVLGQNLFPTDEFTPRYDAGRGLLLQGDGTGALRPMSGATSGLRVWGDARGLATADYDGDGRLDVAVAQNGADVRLFRNQGARPGVRVRLVGPSANPTGIGASLRIRSATGDGPVREVRSGAGYWSVDDAVTVLARPDDAQALLVRWPDGRTSEVPLPTGQIEVRVVHPGS